MKGNLAQAELIGKEALKILPKDHTIMFSLANVLGKQEKYKVNTNFFPCSVASSVKMLLKQFLWHRRNFIITNVPFTPRSRKDSFLTLWRSTQTLPVAMVILVSLPGSRWHFSIVTKTVVQVLTPAMLHDTGINRCDWINKQSEVAMIRLPFTGDRCWVTVQSLDLSDRSFLCSCSCSLSPLGKTRLGKAALWTVSSTGSQRPRDQGKLQHAETQNRTEAKDYWITLFLITACHRSLCMVST